VGVKEGAIKALLTFSVLGGLLSALGILSARTSFDRLHYIGPGVIVMPVPLTVAIVIQNGITAQISVQTLFITAILLATNPVATHAIGRALRVREMHDLRVDATDEVLS
jgi:multisubunit Na+/H+ antiporter MnhG subunit